MQFDLFGVADGKPVKTIKSVTWAVTDHCCRYCYGRVLKRRVSPIYSVVRCAKCDTEVRGDEQALCWCGQNVGDRGKIYECVRNPSVSPELPNAVLVRERMAG